MAPARSRGSPRRCRATSRTAAASRATASTAAARTGSVKRRCGGNRPLSEQSQACMPRASAVGSLCKKLQEPPRRASIHQANGCGCPHPNVADRTLPTTHGHGLSQCLACWHAQHTHTPGSPCKEKHKFAHACNVQIAKGGAAQPHDGRDPTLSAINWSGNICMLYYSVAHRGAVRAQTLFRSNGLPNIQNKWSSPSPTCEAESFPSKPKDIHQLFLCSSVGRCTVSALNRMDITVYSLRPPTTSGVGATQHTGQGMVGLSTSDRHRNK